MLNKSFKYSQFPFLLLSSLIINSFNNLSIETRYYVHKSRNCLTVTQLHWKEALLSHNDSEIRNNRIKIRYYKR